MFLLFLSFLLPIEVSWAKGQAKTQVLAAIESYQPEGWMTWPANVAMADDHFSVPDSNEEILREFQIESLIAKSFQRGQRLVVLKIYKFKTSQGAYGAYTVSRRGATTVVVRGDASSEDDQSLSFWQDDYFISLTTSAEEDDEAKELMRTLADDLTLAIGRHSEIPQLVSKLPPLDRIWGSERLVMGPASAKRMLALPFVETLQLAKANAAAAADYQFQEPSPERLKLTLIDYGNAAEANLIFAKFCQDISGDHDQTTLPGSVVYRLNNSYLYCQLHGPFLAIISGARKRYSPLFLAKQLDLAYSQ